jgi:hypothetical protein
MTTKAPEQIEVSTPVKFVSKCHNQVLTMKPKRNQIIDGMVMVIEGEHIRFDRFEYTTEDPKEINFIRSHKLYGFQISDAAGV